MKKILFLAFFCVSFVHVVFGQRQSNPLIGAWQMIDEDEAGAIHYSNRVKIYTPSGLLKGLENLHTNNMAEMWLDGKYEMHGDSVQGSIIEHSIWHVDSNYIGRSTEFLYSLSENRLTIYYKDLPDCSEVWEKIAPFTQQGNVIPLVNEDNDTIKYNCEKYQCDSKNYLGKPFELAGLWKKGNLHLILTGGDFIQSFDKNKIHFNIDNSNGTYTYICEDGFVFEKESLHNQNIASWQAINGFVCYQRSVLSSTELGIYPGRISFYPLCDGVYQSILQNAMGYLMEGDYYWKAPLPQRSRQQYDNKTTYSEYWIEPHYDAKLSEIRAREEKDSIFEIVEEDAMFPGGDQACFEWLVKHLRYPIEAIEGKKSGPVVADFTIKKDGSADYVAILRSPDKSISDEVTRMIESMPTWKPATINSKGISSRFSLSLSYKLIDKDGKQKGKILIDGINKIR